MKKGIIRITGVLIFCFVVMLAWLFTSGILSRPENNFNRVFLPRPLLLERSLDIEFNSYYIAGITPARIWLGNETAPLFLLSTDSLLADSLHLRILHAANQELAAGRLFVDSANFYLTDRLSAAVLSGATGRWRLDRSIPLRFRTDLIVPLGPASLVSRTFQQDGLHASIVKTGASGADGDLSQTMGSAGDALFSDDGMLGFSSNLGQLVYVYYYRNQYLCMDTDLHIVYRGKTVDTVATATLKVAHIGRGNSFSLSGPPRIVNRSSCVDGINLFVNSALKADNETRRAFKQNAVVDVYDLRKGIYKCSFYIPGFKGGKLKTFRVSGNRLVAIADHYLLLYQLDPLVFRP